jgi:transposase
MEKLLTSIERQKLIARDRIKAVLAYDEGYSYWEIGRILLLDDETIRRHIHDYLKAKKLSTASGGSDSKLSDNEARELMDHLQEITYLYVKDMCQYVWQTYGIKYSVSGMTKWLHVCNFCYKKPHPVPAKADKVKQKKFIQHDNRLKKKAGKNEPIYCADSVHPQHQTQLACGWILKGVRKEVPTTVYQKRLNFIGGICLNGHRFTYRQADSVNANTICDFLWKLRKANPVKFKVHVIWDNAL